MSKRNVRTACLLGAGALLSCGGDDPPEVEYFLRLFEVQCAQVHKCLKPDQLKKIDVGFYTGASEDECQQVNGEEFAKLLVAGELNNNTLNEAAGNSCIDAIGALSCDDVKKAIAQRYDGDDPYDEEVRTALGLASKFKCRSDAGSCLITEASCKLGNAAGACLGVKVFPYKDHFRQDEEVKRAFDKDTSDQYCGTGKTSF